MAVYDPAQGARVTAPASSGPATSSRLRQPRSASRPNPIWSELPAMAPAVAMSPAFARSRCASVLKIGQIPVQQSTAKWPQARAARLDQAVTSLRNCGSSLASSSTGEAGPLALFSSAPCVDKRSSSGGVREE